MKIINKLQNKSDTFINKIIIFSIEYLLSHNNSKNIYFFSSKVLMYKVTLYLLLNFSELKLLQIQLTKKYMNFSTPHLRF